MHRLFLVLGFLFLPTATILAQAGATASRVADIQVGGGFTYANSDYAINKIHGFALYGDVDLKEHLGVELEFHQLNDPEPTKLYERSYEAGVRYMRHYGRFTPYVKGLYGRGVFNFPANCLSKADYSNPNDPIPPYPVRCDASNVDPATYVSTGNIAYNMIVVGGGVDIRITKRINARADYEYQRWFSGPGLSGGLTPVLFTIGAAYHFPAGKPR